MYGHDELVKAMEDLIPEIGKVQGHDTNWLLMAEWTSTMKIGRGSEPDFQGRLTPIEYFYSRICRLSGMLQMANMVEGR